VRGNRPRWVLGISIPLGISYFSLVYRDTLRLDHFEDALYQAVRTLPAGMRVVAPFERDPARAFGYGHIVDRACIGHCYSYANYEAATGQFRVRAKGPNPIVTYDNETSLALQAAKHVVRNAEAPIYYFKWLPEQQRFEMRVLQGGDTF